MSIPPATASFRSRLRVAADRRLVWTAVFEDPTLTQTSRNQEGRLRALFGAACVSGRLLEKHPAN